MLYQKWIFKISLLKDMKNEEIKKLYDNLNSTQKQKLDLMNLRDRYSILRQLLKKSKLNIGKQDVKQIEEPKTPDMPPPL